MIKITIKEINEKIGIGFDIIRKISNLTVNTENSSNKSKIADYSSEIWKLNDRMRYIFNDLGCEAIKNSISKVYPVMVSNDYNTGIHKIFKNEKSAK